MWFKHISGYFRLVGGFSGAIALGNTVTLIARMGESRNDTYFTVCVYEFYQHLTSDAVFLFREEKSGF